MKHVPQLALVIAALALVACGGSTPAAQTGGPSTQHGTGQGGGKHSGGKTGEAAGNKDGQAGGASTEHGSGKGGGRGGGAKAHSGDKNGKPGAQK
jgi:hypothetical protein